MAKVKRLKNDGFVLLVWTLQKTTYTYKPKNKTTGDAQKRDTDQKKGGTQKILLYFQNYRDITSWKVATNWPICTDVQGDLPLNHSKFLKAAFLFLSWAVHCTSQCSCISVTIYHWHHSLVLKILEQKSWLWTVREIFLLTATGWCTSVTCGSNLPSYTGADSFC